jgi:serine kinase of HPr protein (carbohydrate metabolism regulator)
MEQVHATCVDVDGTAVLLLGPPGSGKSDLALRLIDTGARLIADDRTDLEVRDGTVAVAPPATIAGLLEVRGLGVLQVDGLARGTLGLVVELVAAEAVERHPEPAAWHHLGVPVPLVRLDPFEASAPAKVRLAVRRANGDIMPAP